MKPFVNKIYSFEPAKYNNVGSAADFLENVSTKVLILSSGRSFMHRQKKLLYKKQSKHVYKKFKDLSSFKRFYKLKLACLGKISGCLKKLLSMNVNFNMKYKECPQGKP